MDHDTLNVRYQSMFANDEISDYELSKVYACLNAINFRDYQIPIRQVDAQTAFYCFDGILKGDHGSAAWTSLWQLPHCVVGVRANEITRPTKIGSCIEILQDVRTVGNFRSVSIPTVPRPGCDASMVRPDRYQLANGALPGDMHYDKAVHSVGQNPQTAYHFEFNVTMTARLISAHPLWPRDTLEPFYAFLIAAYVLYISERRVRSVPPPASVVSCFGPDTPPFNYGESSNFAFDSHIGPLFYSDPRGTQSESGGLHNAYLDRTTSLDLSTYQSSWEFLQDYKERHPNTWFSEIFTRVPSVTTTTHNFDSGGLLCWRSHSCRAGANESRDYAEYGSVRVLDLETGTCQLTAYNGTFRGDYFDFPPVKDKFPCIFKYSQYPGLFVVAERGILGPVYHMEGHQGRFVLGNVSEPTIQVRMKHLLDELLGGEFPP